MKKSYHLNGKLDLTNSETCWEQRNCGRRILYIVFRQKVCLQLLQIDRLKTWKSAMSKSSGNQCHRHIHFPYSSAISLSIKLALKPEIGWRRCANELRVLNLTDVALQVFLAKPHHHHHHHENCGCCARMCAKAALGAGGGGCLAAGQRHYSWPSH